MVELRRALCVELRRTLLRVKEHLPPADTSGLEDALGHGSDVPLDGTSLLLISAQVCGSGRRAELVALESVGRIRLSRFPHMKSKYLVGSGVHGMDRASEYFRRVARGTDMPLVRAVANEREFICVSLSIPRMRRPGKVCRPL